MPKQDNNEQILPAKAKTERQHKETLFSIGPDIQRLMFAYLNIADLVNMAASNKYLYQQIGALTPLFLQQASDRMPEALRTQALQLLSQPENIKLAIQHRSFYAAVCLLPTEETPSWLQSMGNHRLGINGLVHFYTPEQARDGYFDAAKLAESITKELQTAPLQIGKSLPQTSAIYGQHSYYKHPLLRGKSPYFLKLRLDVTQLGEVAECDYSDAHNARQERYPCLPQGFQVTPAMLGDIQSSLQPLQTPTPLEAALFQTLLRRHQTFLHLKPRYYERPQLPPQTLCERFFQVAPAKRTSESYQDLTIHSRL